MLLYLIFQDVRFPQIRGTRQFFLLPANGRLKYYHMSKPAPIVFLMALRLPFYSHNYYALPRIIASLWTAVSFPAH